MRMETWAEFWNNLSGGIRCLVTDWIRDRPMLGNGGIYGREFEIEVKIVHLGG